MPFNSSLANVAYKHIHHCNELLQELGYSLELFAAYHRNKWEVYSISSENGPEMVASTGKYWP